MKKKLLFILVLPFVAIAVIMIAVIGVQVGLHRQAVQKELAACSSLWDEGKRADAVDRYKGLIDNDLTYMPKSDKTVVVSRVVDFEAENGRVESAKQFIQLAEKQGVPLSLNEPKAKELVAELQKEREQKEAAVLLAKQAADREKKEASERAEKERLAKIKADQEAKDQSTGKKTEPSVPSTPDDNEITVAAKKLAEDYDANAVKADQQYKGRMLVVTGEVDQITTGPFEAVYLVLNPNGQPVMCRMNKQQVGKVAEVKKGDRIKVKGKCDGKQSTVQLSNCELVEQAVGVTGKKLTAFKAIIEKLDKFPDVLAPAAEKMQYADELRKLFNAYEAIPFDPKANRDEAKQIVQLFETKVSGRYSGREYNLIEGSVSVMIRKLME